MRIRRLYWAHLCAAAVFACSGGVSQEAFAQEARAAAQQQAAAQRAAESPAAEAKSPPAAVRQYRDAAAFQERGVYDLAVDEWRKFLERFPRDPLAPKARHYLGVCLLLDKRPAEAEQALQEALRDAAQNELADSTYLHLGLAQYSLGIAGDGEAYQRSADTLGKLIQRFPKSKEVPEALYYRGEALYAAGDKAAGADAYQRLLDDFRQSGRRAEALYALGVVQQEQNQPKRAARTFETYLEEFPKQALSAEVTMRLAEARLALGELEAAEQGFAAAAAAADFAHADLATMRQAATLVTQQKLPQAAALYGGFAQRFPESKHRSAATLAAANCRFDLGQWDAAAQFYEQLTGQDDPLAVPAAHGLARTHLKRHNAAEALRIADAALPAARGGESEADLLLDRADALFELAQRRGEAVAAYALVADGFASHAAAPQARYMAAYAALGERAYPAAAEHAGRFLKEHPQHPLAVDVRQVAGEAQLQQKQYDAAAEEFRTLLESYPDHADAAGWSVRLALAQSLAEKHAEVIATLEPLVATLMPASRLAEAQFLLGSALAAQGDRQRAIAALEASLAAEPMGPRADEALLALAVAQRDAERLPAALDALRRLTSQFPASVRLPRGYLLLADYAAAAGELQEAQAAYERLLRDWPQGELVPHALFGLARVQLSQQQFAAADATLARLLQAFPDDASAAQARYARALALERQDKHAAALDELAQLAKADLPAGERASAQYLEGLCHAGLQAWDPAAAAFQAALASDPASETADRTRYELAWALRSGGKAQEALGVFAELARAHPEGALAAEARYHLGEAAFAAQDYAAAAKHFQASADGAAGSELGEKASHQRAWSLYRQNAHADAARAYQQQLDVYPQGALAADARFMLAESLFGQKQYEAAERAYREALAEPSDNATFRALAYLHGGQTLAQLSQWEASLKLLDEGLTQLPETEYAAELRYESAWALQNLRRADEALARYQQVVDETDREVSARARFMIGEILFEKKEYREAIRSFFKVAYGYGYPQASPAVQVWQANASFEAARCFEVLEMTDQARKSYREVVEKYPDSDKVPLAKQRLEALGS